MSKDLEDIKVILGCIAASNIVTSVVLGVCVAIKIFSGTV